MKEYSRCSLIYGTTTKYNLFYFSNISPLATIVLGLLSIPFGFIILNMIYRTVTYHNVYTTNLRQVFLYQLDSIHKIPLDVEHNSFPGRKYRWFHQRSKISFF